jgi:ubiquinone/menaquinone biosynthesis C-methylase UbiE
MKLTRLGELALNSPTRAFVQGRMVAHLLARLGGRVEGGRALELGCGRGVGGEIILDRFGAAQLELIDIDQDMVERARRRLAGRAAARVSLGDATRIEAPDESFDAAFDFGAIHQMPDWPSAVAEVRRVLKPGARFFFEEAPARSSVGRCGSPSRAGLLRRAVRSHATPSSPNSRRRGSPSARAWRTGASSLWRPRSHQVSSAISSAWPSDGLLQPDRRPDDGDVVCALPSSVLRPRIGAGSAHDSGLAAASGGSKGS